MANLGILEAFAGHTFLSGLGQRDLMLLASGAEPFTATTGTFLAREGEAANAFYLIRTGRVALFTRQAGPGSVPIQTLGAGETLGWSWLVPPHRWQFDCQAAEDVQGIRFNAEWLRDKCENNYELGYHLFRHLATVLAARLAATRLQLTSGPAETGGHPVTPPSF